MEIERHVERLHPFPKRCVARIVKIDAVGVAVYHRADEAEIAHGPLEFVGGGSRVLHGEVGEAGVTLRPALHFHGEEIVGLPGQLDRDGGIGFGLNAGAGNRQDRQGDAPGVHRGKPRLAEIRHFGHELVVRRR